MKFFIGFNAWLGLTEIWTLQRYVAFITMLMLVFGLAFQTPIAIFILTRTGLVSLAALKKSRKFVFLGVFIIAAVVTPPDVVSQVLLGIPLYALFELGILISWLSGRKRKKPADPTDAGDSGPGGSGSGSPGRSSGGPSSAAVATAMEAKRAEAVGATPSTPGVEDAGPDASVRSSGDPCVSPVTEEEPREPENRSYGEELYHGTSEHRPSDDPYGQGEYSGSYDHGEDDPSRSDARNEAMTAGAADADDGVAEQADDAVGPASPDDEPKAPDEQRYSD